MWSLRGEIILVVESRRGRFLQDLERAIEHSGGELVLAENWKLALKRVRQFSVSALVANAEFAVWAATWGLPCIVYGGDADAADVLRELLQRLRL